jgi:hypothetical protein
MAKNKKKDKTKDKKNKAAAGRDTDVQSELKRLRNENQTLRETLGRIADLARGRDGSARQVFAGDADEDDQYTEMSVDVDDEIAASQDNDRTPS